MESPFLGEARVHVTGGYGSRLGTDVAARRPDSRIFMPSHGTDILCNREAP